MPCSFKSSALVLATVLVANPPAPKQVAGGKMSLYSGKLDLKDLVLNEVGIKAVCEEVIKHLPDDTMFSLIVSCGNTIMVNGYIVDKKRYGFITAYSYTSHKGSFPILDGLLKERV